MIITTVFDLETKKKQLFSLPPAEAVICAYEQHRGNYNTFDYPIPSNHPSLEFGTSGRTVFCGQFGAVITITT